MKRGISLIAVLMFMMAATTASIVLFRWISEENFASGSRLKSSEAYQASEAGLDAAYSWLSFKAADVGALLSDYLSVPASTREPRLLNSVLTNQNNPNFDVYLLGADTVSKPYKLKILSVGKGRDNSQISQTATFKVDGLYSLSTSLTLPSELDFDEDFWGNMGTVGFLNVSSAVITQSDSIKSLNITNAGGQALNTITINGKNGEPGYLVLDGDYYTNNGISINGDLYTTGSFDLCASSSDFITGDVYVGGAFHNRIAAGTLTIGGSAYFADTINPNVPSKVGCSGGLGGTFEINGNATMLGPHLIYNNNGSINFYINGSLVMDGNSYIDLGATNNTQSKFEVQKNVAIKNFHPTSFAPNLNHGSNSVIWPLLGNVESGSEASNLCVPSVQLTTETSSCADCSLYKDGSGFYFKTKANSMNVKTPCTPTKSEITNWGADPLDGTKSGKDYKSKLPEEDSDLQSCENTPIVFDQTIYDAVKAGTASWVHSKNKTGSCATEFGNGGGFAQDWGNLGTALQSCWNKVKNNQEELYNGEWLVIYIRHNDNNSIVNFQETSNALTEGKYILIYEAHNSNGQYFYLPPTGTEAQVMFYLPNGYPGTIQLGGTQIGTGYRYFIFSDKNIGQFNTTASRKLHGNVFMNNCAVMNSVSSSSNPYFYSESNTELIQELMKAGADGSGIIQNNPEYGGGNTPPESLPIDDNHIIPIGNRLKVELESKNISREKISNATTSALEGSVLVMPRIIFLPKDAFVSGAKLSDYYTFLYLNNAAPYESGEEPTPTCRKRDGVTTLNITNEALAEGIYTCSFSNNNNKISDFYLQINGDSKMPTISLSANKQTLEYTTANGEDCAKVSINLENGANNASISYSVGVSYVPTTHNGWRITQSDAVNNYGVAEIESSKSSELIYTVCLISEASDIAQDIQISLTGGCDGCNISTNNNSITISKKNTKSYIHRQDVDPSSEVLDCPANIGWQLEGGNCQAITATSPYKNSWECDIGSSVTLKYPQEEEYGSSSCEFSYQGATTLTVLENDASNLFEASYKLKRYQLNVNKPEGSSVTFTAANPHGGTLTETCYACVGIMLYHGLEYTVEIAGEVPIKRVLYNNTALVVPYKITVTASNNVLKIEQGEMAICEFERDDGICPGIDLKDVRTNENLATASSNANTCYFFSSIFGTPTINGSGIFINGETVLESTDLSSLYTKDGGFYVYVPNGSEFTAGTYNADLSESCQEACGAPCGWQEDASVSSSSAASSSNSGGGGISGAIKGDDLRSNTGAVTIIPSRTTSVTDVCFDVSVTIPSSFGENRNTFIISCNASTSIPVSSIDFTMGYGGKCYQYSFSNDESVLNTFNNMRIVINTSSPIGVGENLRVQNVCINSSEGIQNNSTATITCELLNSTADPHETLPTTNGNGSKVSETDLACPW